MFNTSREVGLIIKQNRIKKGMRQTDLAKKLFVSEKTVSSWECGLSYPEIESMNAICDLFGISIGELLQSKPKKRRRYSMKKDELFQEHFTRGGTFGTPFISYSNRKPFLVFIKEKTLLFCIVIILYVLSICGAVFCFVDDLLEDIVVVLSLFVAISTFLSAIYIAWLQRFNAKVKSFPTIIVSLKTHNDKETNKQNLLQLFAINKDFCLKSFDISDLLKPSQSPCSLIKIEDEQNEISDIDVQFISFIDGEPIKTKYYLNKENNSKTIATPIKEIAQKKNSPILFDDDKRGYYSLVYEIKTKTYSYCLITQVLFQSSHSYFCRTNVIYRDEVRSLLKAKNSKRYANNFIRNAKCVLENFKENSKND